MACSEVEVMLPKEKPAPRMVDYRILDGDRTLLAFRAPVGPLFFAVQILKFLGLGLDLGEPEDMGPSCADADAVDELFSARIPCYAVAAMVQKEARRALELDAVVAQLALVAREVGRA